jgi:hypothetical protein
MKKIITLLFAVAAIGSVQAQTTREEARKVVLGGSKGTTTTTGTEPRKDVPRDVVLGPGTSTTSTEASRQAQIDEVNFDYDAKIASIRNNPTLTASEKEEVIARLERDRARKIRAIRNAGTSDSDNDYKNVKKNKAKKEKSNNGNHYGWEKGKGNPHKNGGSPKDKKKG